VEAKRKVVVTGLGLATPLGLDVQESWRKALAGTSGITRLTLPGTGFSPIRAVGAVSQEEWETIVAEFPQEAAAEGERRTLFGVWAARAALEDAKAIAVVKGNERCGVMLAAGLGVGVLEDIHRWVSPAGKFDVVTFGREYRQVGRESMMRNPTHRAAAVIGRKFNCLGSNCTVTSACASATQALGLAFRAIQRGEADLVVAGGSDSMINPVGLVGFALLQAAATGASDPGATCRPFDRKRSGLVIGEGAGVVVVEEEVHALRRGARIYAEVGGYASSMDAYQVTAPHPQGLGAVICMRRALEDAGLDTSEVDYINAHGTGTKLNDVTETLAIKEVFGKGAYDVAISSSKSLIGHLMAAAGGPEFVFSVLSVLSNEIHPTINLTQADPKCDLDYVPHVKRSRSVRAALSNSFGFGGQNGAIIVKKYSTTEPASHSRC
jgi:3-oxoacyl-[acyl-carrier-protein] synthase II